ncbi:MAG: ImmA/IrrE family metallo-endopeptidase, partial [Candidatus Omnitrophota bacterium]|nr:ImmA/IrrE family metallo-endopeptidase [Candidatus Omnitrophota bacterium]
YRKKSSLRIKDQSRIQSLIKEELTDRLRIQELVRPNERPNVPIQAFKIKNLLEIEDVADEVRVNWELGKKEIASITNVLESNLIHVMGIDAHSDFDGISVIAKSENEVRGVGVVARKGICGERQKLNIAHELGHLVLKPIEGLDEEKAAFRFGAAFLAPKGWIIAEVGAKRTSLDTEELFILKKKSGLSVAALLYRLKDLEIISDSYYRDCFKTISRWGWRKEEPHSLPSEENEWLKQNVRKALSEGLISQPEAEKLIGEKIETKVSLSLQKIRSIMNLSLEERRKVLADEAEKISEFYKEQADDLWQSGDFVE